MEFVKEHKWWIIGAVVIWLIYTGNLASIGIPCPSKCVNNSDRMVSQAPSNFFRASAFRLAVSVELSTLAATSVLIVGFGINDETVVVIERWYRASRLTRTTKTDIFGDNIWIKTCINNSRRLVDRTFRSKSITS